MRTPQGSNGWAIRPATESELSEIVQLERETVTAPHWSWADYSALLRAGASSSLRRCLFVAAEGRNISGFSIGSAFGLGSEVEAELESVVVRQQLRRQGLGSALCSAVMDWTRREGASHLNLEVRAGSAGAIRLYGGLGFVATGRRPGYYHDPKDDAIVMRCTLAASPRQAAATLDALQPALF